MRLTDCGFRWGAVIFSAIFLLCNCTKATETHLQVNPQLTSPYTTSASTSLAFAKNQEGEEQQTSYLKAAGRLIHDGHWRQGQLILARMHPLTPTIRDEKNLLLAKIALIREQPRQAINCLAKLSEIKNRPIYYQVQFHEMLAQAYRARGNFPESVNERVKLEHLLPDNASKSNNLRALWLTLTSLAVVELNTLSLEADEGSELKGWMELALISRNNQNPQLMIAALDGWKISHPMHPANALLHTKRVVDKLFPKPKNMALLLPLTGPVAGPAGAIRDGFMAASEKNDGQIAQIRFYDTHGADVVALYHKAIADGADYVVGPLTKKDVAKVSALSHPVPTLLLNEMSGEARANVYQFGLSPVNEARQVAVKARKNGFTRALVITPKGGWGEDVMAAFQKQWQMNGGEVVDALHYESSSTLDNDMREFLHISNSEARNKELKAILGAKFESTPRRRQDFDVIFLVAYPSKARQIIPLLSYYYAKDVPVYATSSVYSGSHNAMKDRDLDGVIFCDMPWVFHHDLMATHWPKQLNSYNRLYALGMDSFALANQLNSLQLFPAMGVHDKSGVLYLSSKAKVSRILAWGQFRKGLAQAMNEHALS